MRWTLRTGARQLVLSTERAAPFAGAIMLDDGHSAASLMRDLAFDSSNMKTLRQIHDELVGTHNSRSRTDTLILAEVMGRVAAGRLFLFQLGRRISVSYDPIEETEAEIEPSEALVQSTPPPEPVEPKPSASVLAQVEALQNAAENGAPFCDE